MRPIPGRLFCLLLGIVLAAACGCGGPGAGVVDRSLVEPRAPAGEPAYRLRVGDVIDVRFVTAQELDYVTTVTPSGTVSILGSGEAPALGRTIEELSRVIEEKAARFVRDPSVTVLVKELSRQPIYVIGEVDNPGEYSSIGRQTALSAISQAGGLLNTAKPSSVMIVRTAGVAEPVAFKVDLKKVLTGEDLSEDVELLPNDVVYAPKSVVGNVANFVDLFFNNIAPAQVFYLRTYDILTKEYRRLY